MAIAVNLTRGQVDVAVEVRERMTGWVSTDEALDSLRQKFPGNDPRSVLLKVAALNQLYVTFLLDVHAMAEHIVSVNPSERADYVETVIAISLPPAKGRKGRTYTSFASKYTHFYVNPKETLIYDSYAVRAAALCVGKSIHLSNARKHKHPYEVFNADVQTILEETGLILDARQLDRYLWLAGQLLAYKKHIGGTPGKGVSDVLKGLDETRKRMLMPPALVQSAKDWRRKAR